MPVNAVIELAVHMHQFQNLALTDKGYVLRYSWFAWSGGVTVVWHAGGGSCWPVSPRDGARRYPGRGLTPAGGGGVCVPHAASTVWNWLLRPMAACTRVAFRTLRSATPRAHTLAAAVSRCATQTRCASR